MIYYDEYNIKLSLNGSSIDGIPINNIKFTLKESIHKIFPEATISYPNTSGELNDSLAFITGTGLKIEYFNNNSDRQLSCPMQILDWETPNTEVGSIGGITKVNLISSNFFNRESKSSAYKGSVSDAISKIASDGFEFSNKSIEDTVNTPEEIWYRTLQTQDEFINSILKYSSSSKSPNSPYFAFSDLSNKFTFCSYDKIISSAKVGSLFRANVGRDGLVRGKILDIKPFSSGYEYLNNSEIKHIHRNSSDEFSSSNINLNKILGIDNNASYNIPLISSFDKPKKSAYSSIISTDAQLSSIAKATSLSTSKKFLSQEKFFIKTILNVDLSVGGIVDITIAINDIKNNTAKESSFLSGNYVIEEGYHTWDGPNKRGYSEFLVSRSYSTVPSSYKYKERIV